MENILFFMKKIHFVGINGSGISGVACIAKNKGYDIDGCDGKAEGDYTKQLLDNNIKIYEGHNKEHLKGKDMVVLSPALLYKDKWKDIEELKFAADSGIQVIKWQKFLGDYIMKGGNVVSICGTHGKTTTTTLTALMFEKGGFDPNVMVGGEVKEWKQNYRVGNSDWYVLESDEYDSNFIDYHPKYIILNNLEMEHPECFKDFTEYVNNFENFLLTIQNNGKIVFNYDDNNSFDLILKLYDKLKKKNVEIIGYTMNNISTNIPQQSNEIKIYIVQNNKNSITINDEKIEFKVLGEHNIKNITISSIMAIECGISVDAIRFVVNNFTGSKRRLDLIFENDRVKIYDDYAHHHTQIQTTIQALKDNLNDGEKIIAILEPHLISRIAQNVKEYNEYMHIADYPIVTKIYKSRESFMPNPDVPAMLGDATIEYIENFDDVVIRVKSILTTDKNNFRILVMGAGYSYQLAIKLRDLCVANN
jgi:UDP-N-acetylmuramate--alanine ligase